MKMSESSKSTKWFREFVAILLWILIFVQLFFFDLKGHIINLARIISNNNQLLFVIGIISLVFLIIRLTSFVLFVLFYPFVIIKRFQLFLILRKHNIKSRYEAYTLLILLSPTLIFNLLIMFFCKSFFRNLSNFILFCPTFKFVLISLRRNLLIFSSIIISSILILEVQNSYVKIASMVCLGLYLAIHFYRQLFSPSTEFATLAKFIKIAWSSLKENNISKTIVATAADQDYKNKLASDLLFSYMYISILSKLVKFFQSDGVNLKIDRYLIFSFLYTFLLVIFIFSFEYYGLFQIDKSSFNGINNPTFCDFIGYSFSMMMPKDITLLKAANGPSLLLDFLQLVSWLLTFVVIIFLLLTSVREKYKKDFDSFVSNIEFAKNEFWELISSKYQLTQEGFEAMCLTANTEITKMILAMYYDDEKINEMLKQVENAKK